jgi:hypothetical protein
MNRYTEILDSEEKITAVSLKSGVSVTSIRRVRRGVRVRPMTEKLIAQAIVDLRLDEPARVSP